MSVCYFGRGLLPLVMVNNIFKALYLIVAICLVIVLFGIYGNMGQADRYKIVQHPNGATIFDTKTHKLYFWNTTKILDKNLKEIKELPE